MRRGFGTRTDTFWEIPRCIVRRNFGDGRINAYNPNTHIPWHIGKTRWNNSLAFDGLWGLFTLSVSAYFSPLASLMKGMDSLA